MTLFDQLMAIVFKNEGGFVSASRAAEIGDPGGETNFGITEVTLRRLGIDKRPEDLSQAECVEIYREHYYKPVAFFEGSDPGLTLILFDSAVQHGDDRAVRFLQRAVGAKPDGDFGPKTRAAAAAITPTLVLIRTCQQRRRLLTRWVQADAAHRTQLLFGLIERVDRILESAYLLNTQR